MPISRGVAARRQRPSSDPRGKKSVKRDGTTMTDRERDRSDPWHHQRKLALSLVTNLGYEDAVDACRRNGWAGVLRVLLEEKGRSSPAGG